MNAPETRTDIAALASRVITVNLPPKEKMDKRATAMLASAKELQIDSDSMNSIAADELKEVKTANAKLEELRVLHVDPLNKEVKFINNWFRDARTLLEEAEESLKTKMLNYGQLQANRRREEQLLLENQQRIERNRLAAESAETARIAKEASDKLLADQNAALALEKQALDDANRLKLEAEKAIREGDEKAAAEVTQRQLDAEETAKKQREAADLAGADALATIASAASLTTANETALTVMSAPVVAEAPKIAGISTKKTFKGKCVDLLALATFVVANPAFLRLIMANEKAINAQAKATGDQTAIDGIQVYEELTLSARKG